MPPRRAARFPGGKCPNKVPPVPLFSVMVREHACTGQFYHHVVEAGSCEQALHLAAGQASGDADHRRCADVWVRSLLGCELAEGHDRPHMAAARGYWRPARWVRDDRGLAHALPGARHRSWHASLTARQVTGTVRQPCSW